MSCVVSAQQGLLREQEAKEGRIETD